jgi:hemolysin III
VRYEIIPFLGLRNPVSSGTHMIALVLSVLATRLLWRRARGHFRVQLTAACFGLSMILLYAASTTFHALQLPWEQLRFFLLLDVSAIYVLIAGTYTPPLLILLRKGRRRNAYFLGIWLMAGMGIALNVMAFTGILSREPYWVGALLYLGMGWFALLVARDLVRTVGLRGFLWAVYGGLAYTLGVAIDLLGRPILLPGVLGPHELFHLFAMAGTLFHFIFIWDYVLPYALKGNTRLRDEATDRRSSDRSEAELHAVRR